MTFLIKAVVYAVAFMPRWLRWMLVKVSTSLAHKSYQTAKRQIQAVYQISDRMPFLNSFIWQIFFLRLEMLHELCCYLVKPDYITIDDNGFGEYLKSTKSGVVVITAHIGSWELLAKVCHKSIVQRFYILAKPSKSRLGQKVLKAFRTLFSYQILWTDDSALKLKILDSLNSGCAVGFAMDQKPQRGGVLVNLLDRPTKVVEGPAKLARMTQAQVVAVYCIRLKKRSYEMIWHPIDTQNCSLEEATQKMADSMSFVIKLYPEQWCWEYKRWSKDELQLV